MHRFYWGSDAAIWNDDDTEQAELLRVSTIEYKKVPPAKQPMRRRIDKEAALLLLLIINQLKN